MCRRAASKIAEQLVLGHMSIKFCKSRQGQQNISLVPNVTS
jgi:hypothetical protein